VPRGGPTRVRSSEIRQYRKGDDGISDKAEARHRFARQTRAFPIGWRGREPLGYPLTDQLQSDILAMCSRPVRDRMHFRQWKRREFITLLGGGAAWPLAAQAQQPFKAPIIGFLGASTSAAWGPWTSAFMRRLGELGWSDGRNLRIE